MSLGLESLELVSLWMVSGWLGSRETSERAWLAPGGLSGSFRGQGIETSSDLVRVLDLLIRVGYLVAPAWLHRTHRRLLSLFALVYNWKRDRDNRFYSLVWLC